MSIPNVQSPSHRRLIRFVDWIRPPEDREDAIKELAANVRDRIAAQANQDGLIVRSMPYSGSFAKRTGLRRHYQGNSEVDGQDVDLAFVLSPRTRDGDTLDELLRRFETYAMRTYPQTTRHRTKSSIRLEFSAKKVNFDLVPMLAVPGRDEEQILLRGDGERRRTSVQKHIEFVRRRNDGSNQQPGRVKFNECVRLLKWWREFRVAESGLFNDVPTIVIELLCAHAFDVVGVEETYTGTLSRWFGVIANRVGARQRIVFSDFGVVPNDQARTGRLLIHDPVNYENDVVPPAWTAMHFAELAQWFATARDQLQQLISDEMHGDDGSARQILVELFGSPFQHHGTLDDVR